MTASLGLVTEASAPERRRASAGFFLTPFFAALAAEALDVLVFFDMAKGPRWLKETGLRTT
jgi:hypothetical protein